MVVRRASCDDFRKQSAYFHQRQRADRTDENARLSRFHHESRKRQVGEESLHDAVTPRAKKTRHSTAFEHASSLQQHRRDPPQQQQRDPPSSSRQNRPRRTTEQMDVEGNIELEFCPSSSFSEESSVRSKVSETKSRTSDLIAMWSTKTTKDTRYGRHMNNSRDFVENHAPNTNQQDTTPRQSKVYGKSWQFPDREPEVEKPSNQQTPNAKPAFPAATTGQTPNAKHVFQSGTKGQSTNATSNSLQHAAKNGQTPNAEPVFQPTSTGKTPNSKTRFKFASPGQTPNANPVLKPLSESTNTKAGVQPPSASHMPSPFVKTSNEQEATHSTFAKSSGPTNFPIDAAESVDESRKSQVDPPTKMARQNDTTPLRSGRGGREPRPTPRSSSRGISGRRPPAENSASRSEQMPQSSTCIDPPPPPPGARESLGSSRGRLSDRASPLPSPPSKEQGGRNQTKGRSSGRASPLTSTPSRDQASRTQSRDRSSGRASPLTSTPSRDQASRTQSRGRSSGRASPLTSTPSRDQASRNQARARSNGRPTTPLTSPPSKVHGAQARTRSSSGGPRPHMSPPPSRPNNGYRESPGRPVRAGHHVPAAVPNLSQSYSRDSGTRSDAHSRASGRASHLAPSSSCNFGPRSASHGGPISRSAMKPGSAYKNSQYVSRTDVGRRKGGRDEHTRRQSFPVPKQIHLGHDAHEDLGGHDRNYGNLAHEMSVAGSQLTSSVDETEYESNGSMKENSNGAANQTPSKPKKSMEKIEELFESSLRESEGLGARIEKEDKAHNREPPVHEDGYHNLSRLQQLERSRGKSRKSTGSMNNVYLSSGKNFRSLGRASPLLKGTDVKDTKFNASNVTAQVDPTGHTGSQSKRARLPVDPDEYSHEQEKDELKKRTFAVPVVTVSSSSSMEGVEIARASPYSAAKPLLAEIGEISETKQDWNAERQFSVDILYPTHGQKKFTEANKGYTIWCSYGHEKPNRFQAWNPPVKVFDTIYPTLEAANNRAKYFFHWENAFGVDPERLSLICNSFVESEKQECKSFACKAAGGGKSWKVSVVPTHAFIWMDRASVHRHPYGDSETCEMKSALAADLLSVD